MALDEPGNYRIGTVLRSARGTVVVDVGSGHLCVAQVSEDQREELSVGDLVGVDVDLWEAELITDDPRPAPKGVGVVRELLEREVIVEFAGGLSLVPASAVVCERGNTVEASHDAGVVRVLSDHPLSRFGDLGGVRGSHFRVDLDSLQETFEDFGGMDQQVARAKDLINLSLNKRQQLADIGGRAIKGILFTGPPGTGKTMLARVVAKEAEAAFFQIKGPQIFSKWVGESEEMLRSVFDEATKNAPSIIFLDEIDAIAGRRGKTHEAGRQVVAQLLTEMDGFSPSNSVVVIAATNRRDDVDPALLRPGRFDWQIPFDEPDEQSRLQVLKASGRRLKLAPDLPLSRVAEEAMSWSAARLAAIWSEAALLAVAEDRTRISREDFLGGYIAVSRRPEPRNEPASEPARAKES